MLRSETTRVAMISVLLLVGLVPRSSAQRDPELERQARNLTGAVFAGSSMDNLRELCDRIGPRVTGTKGHQDAAEWAAAQFHASGIKERRPTPLGWLSESETLGDLGTIFQNPSAVINDFRFALPGESGEGNFIRGAGYFGIDMGLGKTWHTSESSALRFSWETFNITNAVRFDAAALEPIPGSNASGNLSLSNSSSFGNYTSTLTNPRVMQFALRFSF